MKKLPHILIVEDEPAIAELIAVNLRHNGFQPVWAEDGISAQRELDAVLPDVILAGVWGVCFPVLVLWSNGRLKRSAKGADPLAQPDLNGQSDTAPH